MFVTQKIVVIPMPPKRLLWEISRNDASTLRSTLTIEKFPGEYTEEYRALCCDFYLKF